MSDRTAPATARLSLKEALDKVEARFLHNLPEEELSNIERLFFQIEQAHWFYEDFIADDPVNTHLPKFKTLQAFANVLFKRCELLIPLQDKLDMLFNDFCTYRYQIPVCGCILVNPERTHVVLVRNWSGSSWSWPKGKINEGESPFDCGLRETLEETGYNAASLCFEEHFLVVHEDSKLTKLFVAVGVPNDTVFETQTRKEISKVMFHPLQQLPKKIWGVQAFIPKLQRFLRRYKPPQKKHQGSSSGVPAPNSNSSQKKKSSVPIPAMTVFDNRNSDTFGSEGGGHDWSVDDMFNTNAKLTGKTYSYDGNPHSFGSRHPSYVNYSEGESAQPPPHQGLSSTATVTQPVNAFPKNFSFNISKIQSALADALKSTT